ncbi:MAG: ATP-binding protein [Candidatus Diapherotrites archaeon]|nr:ATP-binding protein [Candidatus Diapherotrites archaeon]
MEDFNPWWFGEEDPDISRFNKLRYRWHPPWIDELGQRPGDLNVVVGPRRTGKTLGIKLLIKKLLERGVPPRAILYCGCDLYDDYREIYDALKRYHAEVQSRGYERAYVFLDEVTVTEGWWRAVKSIIDHYRPPWSITVSGSASLSLKKGVEYFGGRRGRGVTVNLMPLSFHEYVDATKMGRSLSAAFERYLSTGGYLAVLNDVMTARDLILFLKSDLLSLGKDPSLAKEIMAALMVAAPSPVSFHSLAADVGVSVKTVRDYVNVLVELFYVLPVLFRNLSGKTKWLKERKYAVRDPFMVRALSLWTGIRVEESTVLEWVVQEHLYRKYGEIYYYRDGYEIDAIAGNEMVEVKRSRSRRRYPRGVKVLSKEEIPGYLYSLAASSVRLM